MILERLGRLQHEFWSRFGERFGPTGRNPDSYWSYEVGHISHVGPDGVGRMKPADLLGSLDLFDAKYRSED